jgi:predicted RNA binding protein YcfA (HicA-like mRNA interferase family)
MSKMMSKNDLLKCASADKFTRGIESLGYTEKPTHGGSHHIYECENKPTISLVNHGHSEISIGVRRNILNLIFGCNPGQNKK